jgi:peptidoglycan-N-acetylglucosamine deacetylase
MAEFVRSDLSELGMPICLRRTVLLNTCHMSTKRTIRPRINSRSLRERFTSLTGSSAQDFLSSISVFEFDLKKTDEVLVQGAEEGGLPLIIVRDGEIIVNFDIMSAQQFEWKDSKRPIYTYIPGFNIQKVPRGIRRPLSNFLQGLHSSQNIDVIEKYGRLPLTDFEFVVLLIHLVATKFDEKGTPLFHWPRNKRAVFVPFHDVDTEGFLKRQDRDPLFMIERKHNIRSTWFVPTAFLGSTKQKVEFLLQERHEVGWHGHNHDHRTAFAPFANRRVKILRESWLCQPENYPTGMRAPKLLKSNHLFDLLDRSCSDMRYDTSFLQGIVPYELWINKRKTKILEIPITVPTDIVVWNTLSNTPSARRAGKILEAQIARTKKLIEAGGVISIVTHPETDLSEQPALLDVYDQYLAYIKSCSEVGIMTGGELFHYWQGHESSAEHLVST